MALIRWFLWRSEARIFFLQLNILVVQKHLNFGGLWSLFVGGHYRLVGDTQKHTYIQWSTDTSLATGKPKENFEFDTSFSSAVVQSQKKKKSWILVIRLFHLVFTVFSSFSSSPFPPRLLPSPSSCFFVQLKWLQKTRGKIETGKWKKEVKKMVYELCCCHACIKILLDEWKKTSSLIGG